MRVLILLLMAVLLTSCSTNKKGVSLFNGKDLENWQVTVYGGEGEVTVEDEMLVLDYGNNLSGVNWSGEELNLKNYEIEFEASRLDGNDFFVGLTFPVNKSYCSLILGGWGGSLCGISSLNGEDAANNDTSIPIHFINKQWYRVRLRVVNEVIQVFMDDKRIVDVNTKGIKLSVRPEVELSRPLGLSSFATRSAYRKIVLRRL